MSLSCLYTSVWASGFLCGAESLRMQEKEVATFYLYRIPREVSRKSTVIVINSDLLVHGLHFQVKTSMDWRSKKHCCKLCCGGGTCPCCTDPASWTCPRRALLGHTHTLFLNSTSPELAGLHLFI